MYFSSCESHSHSQVQEWGMSRTAERPASHWVRSGPRLGALAAVCVDLGAVGGMFWPPVAFGVVAAFGVGGEPEPRPLADVPVDLAGRCHG